MVMRLFVRKPNTTNRKSSKPFTIREITGKIQERESDFFVLNVTICRRRNRTLPAKPAGDRLHAVETTATQDWIPVLTALADETRLRIVRLLLDGPRCVGDISEELEDSNYNISKHLRVLREAELVEMTKSGKTKECDLAVEFRKKLAENENLLDLGCCTFRFDELPE